MTRVNIFVLRLSVDMTSTNDISFLQHIRVLCDLESMGRGCSSVGRGSNRHAAEAGSTPRCGKGFFSQSQLQCRLSDGVRTPPCAVACVNICVHDRDPVVCVRDLWILETLKHPAGTVGLVA